MNGLNAWNVLLATATGLMCAPLVGLAAPCSVDPTRAETNTIVLKADKDGRIVEVRVQPIDTTKKEYVIAADTISIADMSGKATGNLVLTAEGNVALAAFALKTTPSVRIGLVTEPVSKSLAGHLKIRPSEALIVTGVIEGLPAAKAGIKEHDVITRVEGEQVITHVKLKEVLSKCEPEQVIRLRVVREGEPQEVKVRVEAIEPKDSLLTTTDERWWNTTRNLAATRSFVQPQVSALVTQRNGLRYLASIEPQRAQTFVTVDPKISTDLLVANPFTGVQERRLLTLRNLERASAFTQQTRVAAAAGESLETRLLAEITTVEQHLAQLRALVVELEATHKSENE